MRTITNTSKGLGLRMEHVDMLSDMPKHPDIDFLELAPENWMNLGGAKRERLEQIADKYPLVAHGLSLSIGDCVPLNESYLKDVARFLNEFDIEIYSDHLSFSRDSQGYLYDLLPIPRNRENIDYLASRIQRVQDVVARPLVLENISFYHNYDNDIPEGEFFAELIEKSGCQMLLDINNVYVNSINHGFDAYEMLQSLPSDAIRYYHIAGHLQQSDQSLLDTHGKPVPDSVIELAHYVFNLHGNKPLLLERDHNVPPLVVLTEELRDIHAVVKAAERQVQLSESGVLYA
ncbi:hypothetical protein C9980_03970 [Vibrio mediterranei]|uniref:DUF692 domain-containing protein n=1 Tax=Vibrio mediterranei TaxID=689 RepID=UPI000D1853AE|nr:DUF692 domain-containing protein [Vibrio mediterranei]PTC06340.1 hypothetical protein C9980_03970 [Vibrio mediterranei]